MALPPDWARIEVAANAAHQAMRPHVSNADDESLALCCLLWAICRKAERLGCGDAGELMTKHLNMTKELDGAMVARN